MFHSNLYIKEGAFVISDAHYSDSRDELFYLLEEIYTKKLKPTQLIFLGDMFDTLFFEVKKTVEINHNIIELINRISLDIELIYLEGNHDFNLKNIFPNAKIFPINQQPTIFKYKDKIISLAHGDFDAGSDYIYYSKIIRNSYFLTLLSYIDILGNNFILKKLDNYLSKKDDCKKIPNFKELVDKRELYRYNCSYFVDGHFHQNMIFEYSDFTYINIAAFACNQRYFIVKSLQNKELLEEKSFSKGKKI